MSLDAFFFFIYTSPAHSSLVPQSTSLKSPCIAWIFWGSPLQLGTGIFASGYIS